MSKALRILEVCNLDRFAASPYMLPVFQGLVEQGHQVHVACRVTSFAEKLEGAGLKVHDVPITRDMTPISDLKAYRRLKSLIREGGYDIVHTHNPKDGVLGRVAAWKLGVRAVIHTCNGFYFSHRSGRLRRRLVLAAERFAGKRCHLIIFVNTEDLALAAAERVVAPTRARLIYNGVDLERFRPGEDDGLREELGIPARAVVVGYIGEIRREKNLDTLVEAAARLLPDCPELYLVLVGDHSLEPREPQRLKEHAARCSPHAGYMPGETGVSGGEKPSREKCRSSPRGSHGETLAGVGGLKRERERPTEGGSRERDKERAGTARGENGASREKAAGDGGLARSGGEEVGGRGKGLPERLLFTGYRSDPERFYRMFDIYVLPSSREGFGVTIIEAMACGVPVIACNVRGPREIVEDGRDGILVEDRDPSALADAISFYLQAPQAVENYTRRARRKVERQFDHARMRAQLYEEYRRLT